MTRFVIQLVQAAGAIMTKPQWPDAASLRGGLMRPLLLVMLLLSLSVVEFAGSHDERP
jgi:hypothetical protein